MIFIASALVTLICAFFTFALIRRQTWTFYSVFLFSHVYFGIAGPAYWSMAHDNYFIGHQWIGAEERTVSLFLGVFVLVSALLVLLKGGRHIYPAEQPQIQEPPLSKSMWMLWVVGWLSVVYVLARGAAQFGSNAGQTRDPILLILYQFTDILIAVLVYRISRGGVRLSWGTAVGVIAFAIAAVIIGLRYKIALLAVPLLLFFMVSEKSLVKKVGAVVGSVCVLILFSYMTIHRKKFSGISMEGVGSFSMEDFLYGFFAESNIIFGAMAILEAFKEVGDYIFLIPLRDTLVEFLPRALYPAKNVGGYLVPMYDALGGSRDAFQSGTAYPFFCEFYMMGGGAGLVAGLVIYVKLYYGLERSIIRFSSTRRQMVLGLCLLATFFGYYYYSRGYMPQVAKGMVFVILPFIWLLRQEWRMKMKKVVQPIMRAQFSG